MSEVQDKVTVLAVGDISLITRDKANPFAKIKAVLDENDILFGNLETALTRCSERAEKAVTLVSAPENARYLKEADFDVLNLANNHILDAGEEGLSETLLTLNDNNIKHVGVKTGYSSESTVVLNRNGVTIGFAGFDIYGYENIKHGVIINKIDKDSIIEDIVRLKRGCDVVIISLHWGTENILLPSVEQINLARTLIDSGATVILGHHPHVVQGIESYKSGLIAYSLGNFQFPLGFGGESDLNRKRWSRSIILEMDFNKNGLERFAAVPVKVDQDFAPVKWDDEEGRKFLNGLSELSKMIMDDRINESVWFEHIAGEYLSGNGRSFLSRTKKYGGKHILLFLKWLLSPFVLKCYLGLIRSKFKKSVRIMD